MKNNQRYPVKNAQDLFDLLSKLKSDGWDLSKIDVEVNHLTEMDESFVEHIDCVLDSDDAFNYIAIY
jgi:nicotinate-nucleotide pyrophosphorylase